MALVLANRVQETGTPNTTVSFTLTGAVASFQTFAAIGNTNTTYYAATDASGNWEVGLGTYSTTGPTLTRTTVYASSNAGSAVTFSGTCNVFVTYPSGSAVYEDASGNVSALGTITSATWNASTIPVAYGGTGVTTSSGANSVMLRDASQNVAVNRLNQSNTSTVSAAGTTALTAASSYSQTLTGTTTQTYTMPDATTLTTGVAFVFNNNSTGVLTLKDYAAATIGTITAGGAVELVLLANGTTAGTWDVHGYLPEAVTWGTNALALGSTVITGGTWNGGTIPTGYGGTGLTTFTAANNALYSTSSSALVAGTLPVAAGGTGASSASITAFNNITGYSAAGATGTTTTNLVFSTSPTLVTPILGTPQSGTLTSCTGLPLTTGVTGTLGIANGGTGQTTATAAFDALNPNTTLGDITYRGASTNVRLAGNTTATKNFLVQTGTGTVSAAPAWGTIAVGDVPTLNQNTTGSAATLTTTRAIYGNNFNGSAALTQIIASTYGGTGNGFTAFSGPATSEKTFTLPNASATILTSNAAVTVAQGGTGLTSGTSGGIPYYSSTSAIASSALLTQYGVLYGGGAGAAPVATAAGTTGQVLTATTGGAPTWAAAAGATISDDTTTAATYYPTFATATSGSLTSIKVSSTKLTYNPSTGALSSTSHVSSSDERLKTNWRDTAPDFIEQLAGVKNGIFDRTDFVSTEAGVSAQSLQKVLAEAVVAGEDGMLSVNYGGAALVAAIKLAERVVALEARLAALEK